MLLLILIIAVLDNIPYSITIYQALSKFFTCQIYLIITNYPNEIDTIIIGEETEAQRLGIMPKARLAGK